MRFLLDTNIIIPLEDSLRPLEESLARFVSMANEHGHHLLYHPASERDIQRDGNEQRRQSTLDRLGKYQRLETSVVCPWNTPDTSPNDACDNEILYALECDAVDALVTEDKGLHRRAQQRGLGKRVYAIQVAEDFLDRLHDQREISLPNIDEVPLHDLTPLLHHGFFDSLKAAYNYEKWFREKAREGRKAWVYWRKPHEELGALCIFDRQNNEEISDEGRRLAGEALKLCTFKVAEESRGKKIGELFLKMAFRYATANSIESIFTHTNASEHEYLVRLLEDFGFQREGIYQGDDVYLKSHPHRPPSEPDAVSLPPVEFLRRFFPHFRQDQDIQKYIIPIQPQFHDILFPDCTAPSLQGSLFAGMSPQNAAGNAIKLAYLCHAPTKSVGPGDIMLFYRSTDLRAITSLGVVEDFQTLEDPDTIARLVSRRTVYSMEEIKKMAESKEVRVMLFRLVQHFANPISLDWLKRNRLISGYIQSIRSIDDATFQRILAHGS